MLRSPRSFLLALLALVVVVAGVVSAYLLTRDDGPHPQDQVTLGQQEPMELRGKVHALFQIEGLWNNQDHRVDPTFREGERGNWELAFSITNLDRVPLKVEESDLSLVTTSGGTGVARMNWDTLDNQHGTPFVFDHWVMPGQTHTFNAVFMLRADEYPRFVQWDAGASDRLIATLPVLDEPWEGDAAGLGAPVTSSDESLTVRLNSLEELDTSDQPGMAAYNATVQVTSGEDAAPMEISDFDWALHGEGGAYNPAGWSAYDDAHCSSAHGPDWTVPSNGSGEVCVEFLLPEDRAPERLIVRTPERDYLTIDLRTTFDATMPEASPVASPVAPATPVVDEAQPGIGTHGLLPGVNQPTLLIPGEPGNLTWQVLHVEEGWNNYQHPSEPLAGTSYRAVTVRLTNSTNDWQQFLADFVSVRTDAGESIGVTKYVYLAEADVPPVAFRSEVIAPGESRDLLLLFEVPEGDAMTWLTYSDAGVLRRIDIATEPSSAVAFGLDQPVTNEDADGNPNITVTVTGMEQADVPYGEAYQNREAPPEGHQWVLVKLTAVSHIGPIEDVGTWVTAFTDQGETRLRVNGTPRLPNGDESCQAWDRATLDDYPKQPTYCVAVLVPDGTDAFVLQITSQFPILIELPMDALP